ncbi:hypothetical protein CBL_04219 [Carabus blaptoides fortunei]
MIVGDTSERSACSGRDGRQTNRHGLVSCSPAFVLSSLNELCDGVRGGDEAGGNDDPMNADPGLQRVLTSFISVTAGLVGAWDTQAISSSNSSSSATPEVDLWPLHGGPQRSRS